MRSVELGGIDRACEISDEYPVARNVERDTDSFHQMRDQNVRCVAWLSFNVDGGAIDRVTPRRIAAIGPVQDPVLEIQLEVNRFRQMIK